MKNLYHQLLFVLIWSFLYTNGYAAGFTNPISPYTPEDFANPGAVCQHGYYYAVNAEANCSKIVVYKSDKLETLYDSPKVIVWEAPAGTDHSEAIWAPYLQYIQGSWYIYYTATWNEVLQYHRMFVIKSDSQDPQSHYSDCGSVYASNTDFYAIDGKVIIKPTDGSMYFVWSGASRLPYQSIYIAPMDSPIHISGKAVLISGSMASWENEVHEAPAYLYRNGKSIIVYSTGQLLNAGAAGYKMGMLTNIDGNYLNATSWKKSDTAVFQCWNGTGGRVYAPGACCFIKSPDGTEDWMIYHAKHFADDQYNREIRAQKFTWDSADHPLFDHPVPAGIVLAVPSGQEPNPSEISSGSIYKITAKHSLKALSVTGSSLKAGASMEQRFYDGSSGQKWVIKDLNNGYYNIESFDSGMALAVQNGSVDSGAGIIQQNYSGLDDEQWKLCNLGDGNYVITSKKSQKCLEVKEASVSEGARLDQSLFLGNECQEWQLEQSGMSTISQVTAKNNNFGYEIAVSPSSERNCIDIQATNDKQIQSVVLVDLSGKQIQSVVAGCENPIRLDISGISRGCYFLKILANYRMSVRKIVIN
ncbi:MAG: family 43 glycosylhydrolase [Bacteroidota bacterium]|nr:family 43 glycosylhydrolase [Bacteroidota bacterium]